MRKQFFILLMLSTYSLTLFFGEPANAFSAVSHSKEDIIEVAELKATQLGFNLEGMQVTYDQENAILKQHLQDLSRAGVFAYAEEPREGKPEKSWSPEEAYPNLSGRDYQAVYFVPVEAQLGGDLWVFVDRQTGEVIDFSQGE